MMHFTNKVRRPSRPFALTALLAVVLAVGCTTKDDTLGANLVPDNQQMQAGYAVLQWHKDENPKQYVRTRLYQTDSIVISNLKTGYLGTMHNDTVGLRKAGFLSQFSSYYLVDDGYFGYMPIFDSAQILLSVTGYGKDTTTTQKFEVYEVVDNAYLTEKPTNTGTDKRDSVFYMNFNPEEVSYLGGRRVVGAQPLFTFEIGSENGGANPSTKAVTMLPTDAGKEFIERLMLQTGKHKDDYSIYARDNIADWFKIFKGLYIKPADSDAATMQGSERTKGTIYATDLTASGFSVYGRNRVKEDPSLIKDTIGMVYYFNDSELPDCGNVSVNRIVHDYAGSKIDIAEARAYDPDGILNTNRPEKSQVYVEGLGGVVTEIDFTQEFFDDLQALIDKEKACSGKEFRTLAFTQVQMEIYFPGGQYAGIDPLAPGIIDKAPDGSGPLIDRMNAAPSRLGMYTHYWRRINIADYNYTYESYYDTELAYGGRINRSHGCYRMDVTSHVQEMWNQYLEAKRTSDEAFDFETASLPLRKIYLGPEVTDLFTNAYAELQGSGSEMPIRFTIAYNLVK